MNTNSEFKIVFSDTKMRDGFYRFLQVVFHLYPEDRFHHLIAEVCGMLNPPTKKFTRKCSASLKEIKPFLSELTFASATLKKQKREMTLA